MKLFSAPQALACIAVSLCSLSSYSNESEATALNSFSNYDAIMLKRSQGPISESDSTLMITNLKTALQNYKEWKKSPEYTLGSEQLSKAMASHYNDFTVAGIYMFQAKDYQGAYEIWEACVEIPDDKDVAANLSNMQNSRADLAYNRAIAATQAGMHNEALQSYEKAYVLGYTDKQLFDSAILTARNLKQYDSALNWCARGMERHGQTSVYRDQMINIATSLNPEKAVALATEAIGIDPENAKWYNMRAVANEKLKKHDAVLSDLKLIATMKPEDGMAQYNYASKLMFKANEFRADKNSKKEDIKKMYDQAIEAFEKVCQLPKDGGRNNHAIEKSINYLDQFYHQNGDKAGKKRVQKYREALGIRK